MTIRNRKNAALPCAFNPAAAAVPGKSSTPIRRKLCWPRRTTSA
jgi:hypothetical protein